MPGHTLPTRQDSCLDHVMLRLDKMCNCASVAVLNTTVTDHYMVNLTVSSLDSCYNDSLRNIARVNYDNAFNSLIKADVSYLTSCNDPNVTANRLIEIIRTVLLSNTTIRCVPADKRILKPWLTTGVLRCIRLRNSIQLKLRLEPHNTILKITYKRFRNYCVSLLKKT